MRNLTPSETFVTTPEINALRSEWLANERLRREHCSPDEQGHCSPHHAPRLG